MIQPDGGSYFTPIPGDPAAIRDAAARIGRLCAQLGRQGSTAAGEAAKVTGSGWRGVAANRFEGLAQQLTGVHTEVESCLGTLAGALSAYAESLESAQQQIALAERMMTQAVDDYSSALAALPPVPAKADPRAASDHQGAVRSIGDTFAENSRHASRLAEHAAADHRLAVARLTSHATDVAGEAHGVEGTLTKIGDGLGVPVAVLSALSTVAMLRAAGRLATVGSAFAATATQEADQLTRFLGRALSHGDITADEAVARIVQFVDHRDLAAQMFENEARADVASGGLLSLGRFTDVAKWAGRGAGALAILGDVYTVWHPDVGGGWGDAERGVALANGVGTGGLLAVDGMGLAEAGGLVAADTALGWVPIAGQVLVVGTGLYLMGNYLYAHAKWFHDAVDATGEGIIDAGKAVGHGVAVAGEAIDHGAVATGEAIADGAGTAAHAIGTGLSDAGHGLESAAGSVAGFFGL